MRISDWSSDVCSSDLDVGHQRLFAAAVPEILAHRLGEILGMVDQQRDRAVDTVGSHREAFGHRGGKTRLLRREHLAHPPRLALDCRRHSCSPPLRPVRSCRSEEHTSELQSLMRISYAVFCLKKKKHK